MRLCNSLLVTLLASVFFRFTFAKALPSLVEFETRYIESLQKGYEFSNGTIKLIGYQTIYISTVAGVREFDEHYDKNFANEKMTMPLYYEKGSASYRVYFPVQGALMEHSGSVVEANSKGEIDLEYVIGDLAVLGRRQTEHVTGVWTNIIKDGIIYLAERNRPTHRVGNTLVYDFGTKSLNHHHDHGSDLKKREDGEVRCMDNHGGPNCSDAFDIHGGGCPFRSDVCVDYNGYFTDCVKGDQPILNFPGSDCFWALAWGNCWNEVM